MILTVQAAKIAVAEKHITDPLRTADNRLFTMMYDHGSNIDAGISLTEAVLSHDAVCSASMWTAGTGY
jgi:hypothetical protein